MIFTNINSIKGLDRGNYHAPAYDKDILHFLVSGLQNLTIMAAGQPSPHHRYRLQIIPSRLSM